MYTGRRIAWGIDLTTLSQAVTALTLGTATTRLQKEERILAPA